MKRYSAASAGSKTIVAISLAAAAVRGNDSMDRPAPSATNPMPKRPAQSWRPRILQTTPALSKATPRWPLLALSAILVVAVVLRVLLFRGYVGLDDGEYALMAHQMSEGAFQPTEYVGPPVFPLRVGLIAPAALSFELLGFGEWPMVVYPLLTSLLSIVLVYFCAAQIFSPTAGVVAAAALTVVPQDVEMATKLLPDQPAALFTAAGVAVAILLARRRTDRAAVLFGGGILGGLLLGVSWLHKESIAYVGPFMVVLLVMSVREQGRAILPLWIGIAAGSAGTLLAEMALYRSIAGDALFRFHEIERNYDEMANGFFTEGSDFGWQEGESAGAALRRRLFVTGPQFLLVNPAFAYLPLAGTLAAVWGGLARDRSFLLPSLWLVSLLAMFNFASSSSTSYMPLALYHRYVYPLAFPAALLVGGLVARQLPAIVSALRERRVPLKAAPAIAAFGLVFLAAAWSHQYPLRHRDELRAWTHEVRDLSREVTPETALYADTLSLRGLSFYTGFPRDTRWVDFERVGAAEEVAAGSLVLVNRAYLDWLQVNSGMWLSDPAGYVTHDFYQTPPSTWTKLRQYGTAALYRVEPARGAE
jgi:4-amino-4-deoxy-L-arabinose transferase-like glycosyltransferase